MNARDELFAYVDPEACGEYEGKFFTDLLDAYAAGVRKAALEEAEELAEVEGYRLYDDTGLKAAEAAWGVSDKIREMIEKGN